MNRHYEGYFTDNDGDNYHEFDPPYETLILDYIPYGGIVHLGLSWNDWPGSNQDYDLYLYDSGLNLVGYSLNVQSGSQPPVEMIVGYVPYGDNYHVVIKRHSSNVNVHFELYSFYNNFLSSNCPEGSITCPADAFGSMTVGATNWQDDSLESFSSRGPTNDGRIKPDVTAPDFVSTWSYGTEGFPGTSASSPHTAGAAALLKSVDSSLIADDLQNLLESTALDLGSDGKDNLYGSGRIDVWDAYNSINKVPVAYDDFYGVVEDGVLLAPEPGVLGNDTDADSDPLTAIKSSDPSNGLVTLNANGSFVYTPNPDYSGSDSFTYKANDSMSDSNIATVYITITPENDPPTANFTYIPSSPTDLDIIQFTDTSTDLDGTIVSWLWDFGDEATSTGQNPSHQYADDDTYTVNITVTDDDGATDSVEHDVTVSNVPPTAEFSYSPPNPTTADMVSFTDESTDTDGIIASWSWDFGDGTTSTGQNPSHQYADDGIYTVTLTVTDNDGATDDYSENITISNIDPIANYTYSPPDPTTLDVIQFTDTSIDSDGNIVSWLWDFGDDNNSTEQNPTHQYADDGVYPVNLIITDNDDATDDYEQDISVLNNPPTAYIDSISPNPAVIGETVFFNGHGVDIDGIVVAWQWNSSIDGSLSIQPSFNTSSLSLGTHTISLTVKDDDGGWSPNATQTLTINNPPVVGDIPDQTINEGENFATISLDDYVADPDNYDSEMTWTYSGNVDLTVSIDSNRIATIGIPDPDWYGQETITFTATDPGGLWDEDSAVFNVTAVNDPPVANDDYYSVDKDTILNVVAPGVLGNDTDVESDPLTSIKVSDPSYGTLTAFNIDGSFTYTPNEGYVGFDIFTYKANDGFDDSNIATVHITVTDVNDPPVASGIPDQSINEGDSFATINLDDYVDDPDNDDDEMTWAYSGNVELSVSIVDRIATIDIPNPDWYGQETITFRATDPGSLWDEDSAVFNVTAVNDPPVANDDYYSVDEDTTLDVAAPGVLANDTDVESDPLTAIKMSDPTDGTLTAFNTDGSFTYAPDGDFFGYDSFTYKANDGSADSNIATVYITVILVNDPPVTNDDYATTNEDTPVVIDVLANDTDVDTGDMLTVQSVTDPLHGTATNNMDNVGYTPDFDYCGTDSFEYTASDGNGGTDTAIVYVTIICENDPPVVDIPDQTIVEGGSFTPIILDDYVDDVDNSDDEMAWTYSGNVSLTVTIDSSRVATVNPPNLNWVGSETITFNATDPGGLSGLDDVTFTVLPENDPPIANFTYSPENPTTDDTISFIDTSTDTDGYIASWLWDFGDGGSSPDQNSTHQYPDNLTYNVTLTVEDNDGDNSSITKQIITRIIYTNITKEGNETTINLQNGTDMIIVINTTNSTTVNVSKYSGNPTGKNISGNITAIGKYVGVEVENERYIVWPIDIKIYYTQDDLNNSNIDENQLLGIYFWNDTTEKWQLYNDTGVTTTYNQSGYEGYCWANAWHLTPLTLGGDNEPPKKVTGLTVTDAKDGKLNLAWIVSTDNVAVDHYKIYRSGEFLTTVTIVLYQDTGLTNGQSYSYQVSAVDTSGNEGEKSDSVSGTPTATGGNGGNGDGTTNLPPIADANGPYTGTPDEEITFDGSGSSDPEETELDYRWDFDGDGEYDTDWSINATATYSYPDDGIYTVILQVRDGGGLTDNGETNATIITLNIPPTAPEVTGETTGMVDTEYTFTAVSTDADNDNISYTFDWGDDSDLIITGFLVNGTQTSQTHTWTVAGTYTITVYAEDEKNALSGTTKMAVFIDMNVRFIDDVIQGYLLDTDNDGIYDVFHNNMTGNEIIVELQNNGNYLIDSDGDVLWDYEYDPETSVLTSYSPLDEEEDDMTPWYALIVLVVVIVISAIFFAYFVHRVKNKKKKG